MGSSYSSSPETGQSRIKYPCFPKTSAASFSTASGSSNRVSQEVRNSQLPDLVMESKITSTKSTPSQVKGYWSFFTYYWLLMMRANFETVRLVLIFCAYISKNLGYTHHAAYLTILSCINPQVQTMDLLLCGVLALVSMWLILYKHDKSAEPSAVPEAGLLLLPRGRTTAGQPSLRAELCVPHPALALHSHPDRLLLAAHRHRCTTCLN